MPFVAIHAETEERIDITEIENPREVLRSGDCVCQLCGEPLIVKAGLIVTPHFAHYAECTSDYQSHPETPAHREAKRLLRQYLRDEFAEYANAKIEIEVPIPEARRVADVMATFPMGWRVAHEIQLSSITTRGLQERTNDYSNAGIDVVWWLGKSADTPANRRWCVDNFGYVFVLNLSEDESNLD